MVANRIRSRWPLALLALAAFIANCAGGETANRSPADPPGDASGDASGIEDMTSPDVLRCGPGQTACEGSCASTEVDPANCGACGRRCGDLERCMLGRCAPACPGGQTLCTSDAGARCVVTATDGANCGTCGRTCSPGEVCSEGSCAPSCAAPLQLCTDDRGQRGCADLMRDPRHCGTCNRGCAPGQACESGRCVLACPEGFTVCGAGTDAGIGSCADLRSDRSHCGACGRACPAGEVCTAGRCEVSCGAGLTSCVGACRDLRSDRTHCGACGNACTTGESCVDGRCVLVCPEGFTNCADACRDLRVDPNHCGACGRACAAGETCLAGRCEFRCPSGLTACAGRCVVTTTDPAHCGACNLACPMAANGISVCAAGRCGVLCAPGFSDCNGAPGDGCELAIGRSCTLGLGACVREGVTGCVGGTARCVGAPGTPGTETCNNVDDNCDGVTDEGLTQACYAGPAGTADVGACRRGSQACTAGSFGACTGQVLPSTEVCGNNIDENCNGMTDEGCQGNGASCRTPILVTASTSFSRNTCMDAGDSGSDTTCGTNGSPEHVYLVRLTRPSTVVIQVTGFLVGGNEGDVLYRGTSCPGMPVACTEHNTEMRRLLGAGDHYFFIEDDHAACQPYSVSFGIL